MTKEIFKKIFNGGILSKDDLTPDEKKDLYAYLATLGMSQSTTYLRFFFKGFKTWEIQGITKMQDEFFVTSCPDENTNHEERGYAYVLSLQDDKKFGFYDICRRLSLCSTLVDFMSNHQMSPATTSVRFRKDNWKEWELKGIRQVIDDFFVASKNNHKPKTRNSRRAKSTTSRSALPLSKGKTL